MGHRGKMCAKAILVKLLSIFAQKLMKTPSGRGFKKKTTQRARPLTPKPANTQQTSALLRHATPSYRTQEMKNRLEL